MIIHFINIACKEKTRFCIPRFRLVASSLISQPNVQTVSTFIVREFEQASISIAMAMALICVIITSALLIFLNNMIAKRER